MTFYIANDEAKSVLANLEVNINLGGAASIILYDGAVPTDPDAAATNEVATLTFSADSFGTPVDLAPGASITANAITSDIAATGGTATYFRVENSAGNGTICQGTVGTGAEDLVLDTNIISVGATVAITSFVLTMPES